MKHKIIICGGNGAGKSTLGKALAHRTGWVFRDIEDYYFPKTNPDYPYAVQRTEEEVVSLLYEDLKNNDNLIYASVRGNHSEKTAAMFTCAVFVSVPKEVRMKRVRQRSFDKFGDRVLEGGDLYESEKAFYDIIEKRTDKTITDWLETMDIPVIRVDGTKAVEENVEIILSKLNEKCNLKSSELSIKDYIYGELPSEAQSTALNLVSFLEENGITFHKDNCDCWKNKIYYWCKYNGDCICFISIKDPDEPQNLWTVWSDDMKSEWFENCEVDNGIKELAWKYIDHCGYCGSCGGGKPKIIFGREFKAVCGCTFRVDNPSFEDLDFLKKIIEIRIRKNSI